MRRSVRSAWIGFCLVLAVVSTGLLQADDWPQFCGGSAVGRAGSTDVPLGWAPDKNLAWRTGIPGSGWSQAIVVVGRLYVTTAVTRSGGRPSGMMGGVMSLSAWGMGSAPSEPVEFRVLRLDAADGRIAWSRSIADVKPKFGKHASNTFACSPVADAEGLYFGTSSPGSRAPAAAIVAGCAGDLTLKKGESKSDRVLWSRVKCGAGMPSPVVVGDHLVNERGRTVVVKAGGAFEGLAESSLGDSGEIFWATPAVADGALFIRSSDALYCVRR